MRPTVILLLIVMAGIACKKDAETPTIKVILESSKWRLDKLLLESPLGSNPADITLTAFKQCEVDDVIEFKTGGVFSCTENVDVCPPGSNNSPLYALNGGSWALSGDTLLTIQKGATSQAFRFSKKTTSVVELYQQQKNILDQLVRYTYVIRAVE